MTDTIDVVEPIGFDPDAVFQQAQQQVDSIKAQIAHQQSIKSAADVRIRDLRAALVKTERIVSAMTPRTRVVTKKEGDVAPKVAKKPAAKKATANA